MSDRAQLTIPDRVTGEGAVIEVIFPLDLIQRLWKTNPTRYENLRTAKAVLEDPLAIFEGPREYQQGGWAYIGHPPRYYPEKRTIADFPRHLLYAVYLNPYHIVYNWRVEVPDPEDPDLPKDHLNRYRRLAWKKPKTTS